MNGQLPDRSCIECAFDELSRLYIAYRVFYGEAPEEERAAAFIRDRVRRSSGRYFLAWDEDSPPSALCI